MADIVNMARMLAIAHIIVGSLLLGLGTADFMVIYFWTGVVCFGIWIGVWMCIGGIVGIEGTRKEPSPSRNCRAGVFMGFSITSAVMGGIVIICYGASIAANPLENQNFDHRSYYTRSRYDTQIAISATILSLGVVEFVIGIWAAVCLCRMKPCMCCYGNPPQQGQGIPVMYTVNSGYVMTQAPGGVPVAVPMQAGGDMIAVQAVTPGAHKSQPQNVMVPVSGATSGVMDTGYQPQQVELPPPYGQNVQMPMKTYV